MWATPNTTMASEERVKDHDLFVENSPLFKRMSIVCHVTIFLYATSFWIQIGVFPVNHLIYTYQITDVGLCINFSFSQENSVWIQ